MGFRVDLTHSHQPTSFILSGFALISVCHWLFKMVIIPLKNKNNGLGQKGSLENLQSLLLQLLQRSHRDIPLSAFFTTRSIDSSFLTPSATLVEFVCLIDEHRPLSPRTLSLWVSCLYQPLFVAIACLLL